MALPRGTTAPGGLASKTVALLAYLTLEAGPHSREELATLLWGESPETAARASLRQALKQLRAATGEAVRVDRQKVELADPVECDVTAFLEAAGTRPSEALRYDVPRFMSGFSVRHAPGFEEWMTSTRQMLRRRYEQLLRAAARDAVARSHFREAAMIAERWLAVDPLSDEATRVAVEALYMLGDRAAALARLAEYRNHLARELRTPPSAALLDLARRLETDLDADRRRAPAEETGAFTPSFQAGLVGRERQWGALMQAWHAVAGGAGRVVLVEGEVGVGKTRLAEDFVRWTRAQGATVLRGRGYDPKTGIPFGPIAEMLREALEAPGVSGSAPEWLTEVTRLLPELRRRFPGLPEPPAPTDAADRWRLFEGVAQLLLALASERPTILLIDDLQWCDGETCALLHFLSRRLEIAAAALVATVRLGELERDLPAARLCRSLRARAGATVVEVPPLTVDELWLLIREMGKIRSPTGGRRFASRIHEVTDGNPFHAIELLKTLFTQGLLAVDDATGEWTASSVGSAEQSELLPMPPTVRDAIAERVTRLPYDLRDLLATIAVSASGCRTPVLSHVHGISRLQAALRSDALVERHLLAEDGGVYRCAHPVIADVVRDGLSAPRRREIHRAIALSLEAVAGPAELAEVASAIARHAARGGERALAYRFALLASEEAVRRYAFEEALSWLDLAAGVAEEGAEADMVNRSTADVLGLAGWTEPPRRPRRPGTPARGIAQIDLDLGVT
ncbi:MAG: AAA family ATPase [Gemmatimonadetes bacterium]|nr:AAA family ATPase [Gemmatimonadota bacterium]